MKAAGEGPGARQSARCVEEAEEKVEELRRALAKARIILPSLGIDPAIIAREAPCPLVVWGGCSMEAGAHPAVALR